MQIPEIPAFDQAAADQARARQSQLTKPAGALGRLEALDLRDTGTSLDLSPLMDIPTLKRLVLTPDMRAQAQRFLGGAGFEIAYAE